MAQRDRIIVAVVWALSLLAVGAWTHAQDPMILQQSVVYSGADVGIRVYTPLSGGGPVGTVVVRIAGRWQDVEVRPNTPK
jgi:hypothetical protein